MENKKEPLMSWKEWLNINANTETDENWIDAYVKYHTQWHLNNSKEFVADEAKVFGNGKPNGVKKEFIVMGVSSFNVDKQSIHTAIDNYIKDNL